MLATFLVGNVTTVIGDDTNFTNNGKFAFRWESWSVQGLLLKEPGFQSPVMIKQPQGNIDRTLGFRIGRSLATIAAVSDFFKTVDSLVMQTGTLVLQPDASKVNSTVYENCTLVAASFVPGGEDSAGTRVTMSYRFEPIGIA